MKTLILKEGGEFEVAESENEPGSEGPRSLSSEGEATAENGAETPPIPHPSEESLGRSDQTRASLASEEPEGEVGSVAFGQNDSIPQPVASDQPAAETAPNPRTEGPASPPEAGSEPVKATVAGPAQPPTNSAVPPNPPSADFGRQEDGTTAVIANPAPSVATPSPAPAFPSEGEAASDSRAETPPTSVKGLQLDERSSNDSPPFTEPLFREVPGAEVSPVPSGPMRALIAEPVASEQPEDPANEAALNPRTEGGPTFPVEGEAPPEPAREASPAQPENHSPKPPNPPESAIDREADGTSFPASPSLPTIATFQDEPPIPAAVSPNAPAASPNGEGAPASHSETEAASPPLAEPSLPMDEKWSPLRALAIVPVPIEVQGEEPVRLPSGPTSRLVESEQPKNSTGEAAPKTVAEGVPRYPAHGEAATDDSTAARAAQPPNNSPGPRKPSSAAVGRREGITASLPASPTFPAVAFLPAPALIRAGEAASKPQTEAFPLSSSEGAAAPENAPSASSDRQEYRKQSTLTVIDTGPELGEVQEQGRAPSGRVKISPSSAIEIDETENQAGETAPKNRIEVSPPLFANKEPSLQKATEVPLSEPATRSPIPPNPPKAALGKPEDAGSSLPASLAVLPVARLPKAQLAPAPASHPTGDAARRQWIEADPLSNSTCESRPKTLTKNDPNSGPASDSKPISNAIGTLAKPPDNWAPSSTPPPAPLGPDEGEPASLAPSHSHPTAETHALNPTHSSPPETPPRAAPSRRANKPSALPQFTDFLETLASELLRL